jgi:hypothetical protein
MNNEDVKILDDLLSRFDEVNTPIVSYFFIKDEFMNEYKITADKFKMLYNVLLHDKYIEENNELMVIKLTPQGYKFKKDGGYKAANNWWLKNDLINLKWIITTTIALAGLIAAIYAIHTKGQQSPLPNQPTIQQMK